MSITADLRTFLMADSAVSAAADYVVRNDIPESLDGNTVRYQRTQANDNITRDVQGGLTESIFSIDCFAQSQGDADDLADAVKAALQGFRPIASMGSTSVQAVFVRDKSDDYTPFPEGSDIVIPFSSMDAEIWHT